MTTAIIGQQHQMGEKMAWVFIGCSECTWGLTDQREVLIDFNLPAQGQVHSQGHCGPDCPLPNPNDPNWGCFEWSERVRQHISERGFETLRANPPVIVNQ